MSKYFIAGENRYQNLYSYIQFFRSKSSEIEANPDSILNYLDHDVIKLLTTDYQVTPLERTTIYEALAYGDVNVLFACPRTCLSGILIRSIGSQEQQEFYFNYLAAQRCRSFFAATEPLRGSDANHFTTQLILPNNDESPYLLGEKILIGNGASSNIGTVIARTASGPLGLCAVLITPEDFVSANTENIWREKLPMTGIAAAQLAYMRFNKFPVQKKNLLGQHLSAAQRGLTAVLQTLNKMRLAISALAIGHAQSIVDYIVEHKLTLSNTELTKLKELNSSIQLARIMMIHAAKFCDEEPNATHLISLAKVTATEAVESVAKQCFSFFNQGGLIEHPFLAKRYLDAFGFEYLDGTSNIQRKNIYQGFVHGLFNIH